MTQGPDYPQYPQYPQQQPAWPAAYPQTYYPGYYTPPQPLSHSGFGIASFIISLIAGLGIAVLIGIAGMMAIRSNGQLDEHAPEVMALGCCVIIAIGLLLLGLLFGIIGLVQSQRKKVFAVLGTIFNALALLGFLLLAVIGNLR